MTKVTNMLAVSSNFSGSYPFFMIHELSTFQWYTNMGKCNFIIEVYRTYKCLYIDISIILINILMLNLPYFQVSPDYFPPEFSKCFLVLPSIHFVKLCWLHVDNLYTCWSQSREIRMIYWAVLFDSVRFLIAMHWTVMIKLKKKSAVTQRRYSTVMGWI